MASIRDIDERFGNTRQSIELSRADWESLRDHWRWELKQKMELMTVKEELTRVQRAMLPVWRAARIVHAGLQSIKEEYGKRDAVVRASWVARCEQRLRFALDDARKSKQAKYLPRDRDGNIIPQKTPQQLGDEHAARASALANESSCKTIRLHE